MSLSLTLGSFVGLQVWQVQGLGLVGLMVQLSSWQSTPETEGASVSAKMSGSQDRGWELVGCPQTCGT